MQEGISLRDYLDILNKILDLRNVEVKVKDEDVALILLMSLPLSYENLVDSYIRGKETLNLKDTKSTLLMREDRQKCSKLGYKKSSIYVSCYREQRGIKMLVNKGCIRIINSRSPRT